MSAVVQTGSSDTRSACGVKMMVFAPSACTIRGAASAVTPARAVFRTSRRCIFLASLNSVMRIPTPSDVRQQSHATNAVELRQPLVNIGQVFAERGRLVQHAEWCIRRVAPELHLHFARDRLLCGEVGRIDPGRAQPLHVRIGWPADPDM